MVTSSASASTCAPPDPWCGPVRRRASGRSIATTGEESSTTGAGPHGGPVVPCTHDRRSGRSRSRARRIPPPDGGDQTRRPPGRGAGTERDDRDGAPTSLTSSRRWMPTSSGPDPAAPWHAGGGELLGIVVPAVRGETPALVAAHRRLGHHASSSAWTCPTSGPAHRRSSTKACVPERVRPVEPDRGVVRCRLTTDDPVLRRERDAGRDGARTDLRPDTLEPTWTRSHRGRPGTRVTLWPPCATSVGRSRGSASR